MNYADEYQKLAARTLIDAPGFTLTDADAMLAWNAMGLAGEAGEVADHVKKRVFHRHDLDETKLRKELGDCLWYIAAICTHQGWPLSEVMAENIEKLRSRYPDGYSADASRHRTE